MHFWWEARSPIADVAGILGRREFLGKSRDLQLAFIADPLLCEGLHSHKQRPLPCNLAEASRRLAHPSLYCVTGCSSSRLATTVHSGGWIAQDWAASPQPRSLKERFCERLCCSSYYRRQAFKKTCWTHPVDTGEANYVYRKGTQVWNQRLRLGRNLGLKLLIPWLNKTWKLHQSHKKFLLLSREGTATANHTWEKLLPFTLFQINKSFPPGHFK